MSDTESRPASGPIVLAVLGGAVIIAGAVLINGCSDRGAAARNADAAHILQAINTEPVQAAKNLRFLISAELIRKEQRDRLATYLSNTQYGHGPALAPSIAGSQCTLPPSARPDLKIQWLNIECGFWFPPDNGFAGKSKPETLEPKKLVDRYGGTGGTFLSPEGVAYELRALPYKLDPAQYHRYEVAKPLKVDAGSIARWFDQPGGGTQYKTSKTVQQLLDDGVLKEVPK